MSIVLYIQILNYEHFLLFFVHNKFDEYNEKMMIYNGSYSLTKLICDCSVISCVVDNFE